MLQYFIGRQPILDSAGETIAYELLYRSSLANTYDPNVDGDSATSQVLINSVEEMGLSSLVGDKLAFVNLTNRFLEQPQLLEFLPSDRVVLEVLESVVVNEDVLKGIVYLREANFKIALDDYSSCGYMAPLLPHAQIVKYDISQYTVEQLCEVASLRAGPYPKLLAERVETEGEFNTLREAGFDYFQGFYFARPKVISGRKIPVNKGVLLHLLARLNNDAVTPDEIADIMSREMSLGLRALRYINSPLTGLHVKVTSIKQAAVLLGRDTIRYWVIMLLVADLNDKPMELVTMSLVRGRFCQLTARNEGVEDENVCFTAGLLSLINVMMDLDMEQVLDNISATPQLREILQHNKGRASEFLEAIRFIESHDGVICSDIVISEAMNDAYIEAIEWAGRTTEMLSA